MKNVAIIVTTILAAIFLLTFEAFAGGIQGRAAIKGEVVEGVKIYVYKDFSSGLRENYFKVSEPTKLDGTYKIDLPAGHYYFIARKTKDGSINLSEGDLYCYYSGSPLDVTEASYRNIGFNLIRIPPSVEEKKEQRAGVYGTINYDGKLLEKVYLFAYKNADSDFKGPAEYFAQSASGKFKLTLPDGEYYLIARKRKKGGMYGPIEKDDIFNYYYGNPVQVKKNVFTGANVECITRLDMLEEPLDTANAQGIIVHVKDEAGAPLQGLYLLVYADAQMKGRPTHISEKSDENGKIFIELNSQGKYYLIVRSALGGPAYDGEYYSKYSQNDGSVTLEAGNMRKEIDFKVSKFKQIQ